MFESSPSQVAPVAGAVAGAVDTDAGWAADELRSVLTEERRAGARKLWLAAHWADLHGPESLHGRPDTTIRAKERLVRLGAEGTPEVAEFAVAELGCYLEVSTASARALVRDSLNLRHRHPLLWHLVMELQVPEWQARLVARKAADGELTLAEARWLDAATGPDLAGLPVGRALALVEARIIEVAADRAESRRLAAARRRYVGAGRANEFGLRTLVAQTVAGDVARFDAMVHRLAEILGEQGDADPVDVRRAKAIGILAAPATACLILADATGGAAAGVSAVELAAAFGDRLRSIDPARLAPPATLYVHLHQAALAGRGGVGRMEGVGPITIEQVRDFLASSRVTVRPVLDLADKVSVDSYEFPHLMREQVLMRQPIEVFPYGTTRSRAADLDHTTPYLDPADGGPPGQTTPDNAGPLSRHHHRLRTHGHGWRHLQPMPGLYLWRTPQGHWFQVDHRGTTHLGSEVGQTSRHHTQVEAHFAGLLAA